MGKKKLYKYSCSYKLKNTNRTRLSLYANNKQQARKKFLKLKKLKRLPNNTTFTRI